MYALGDEVYCDMKKIWHYNWIHEMYVFHTITLNL